MQVRGNGRGRKAVLSALAAVGEQGMTLFALGVAVDLPEPNLQALLNQLVLSGHVGCVGDAQVAPAGRGRAMYRLARAQNWSIPTQRRAV